MLDLMLERSIALGPVLERGVIVIEKLSAQAGAIFSGSPTIVPS